MHCLITLCFTLYITSVTLTLVMKQSSWHNDHFFFTFWQNWYKINQSGSKYKLEICSSMSFFAHHCLCLCKQRQGRQKAYNECWRQLYLNVIQDLLYCNVYFLCICIDALCSNFTLANKGAHDVLIKAVPKLTRFDGWKIIEDAIISLIFCLFHNYDNPSMSRTL